MRSANPVEEEAELNQMYIAQSRQPAWESPAVDAADGGHFIQFKRFFNVRRVLAGVELVHKIINGQFGLLKSFGTDPLHVWYNVLAA
jgi:hypothetical protein